MITFNKCSSYPIIDANKDNSGNHMIKFHVYQNIKKFSIHNVYDMNDKDECTKLLDLEGLLILNNNKDKIYNRTKLNLKIYIIIKFHEE